MIELAFVIADFGFTFKKNWTGGSDCPTGWTWQLTLQWRYPQEGKWWWRCHCFYFGKHHEEEAPMWYRMQLDWLYMRKEIKALRSALYSCANDSLQPHHYQA